MYCFRIADITIDISWENAADRSRCYAYHDCTVLPRALEAFRAEAACAQPDMTVRIDSVKKYKGPAQLKKIYDQSFYEKGDRMILTIYDPCRPNVPGCSIAMSKSYSDIEYIPHIKEYEHYDLQWLMHPFEGLALHKGGLVLHGAAVEYQDKGFIFTGISGSGKSTQAHLWQKYRNALIINGDCPYIKLTNGSPRMYGTPFCGSSGESINRSTALHAVILVRQGSENTVTELKGQDAFLAVFANVLHSNFDAGCLDLVINNLKSVMTQIRVFELTCTIGVSAVEVLEKALM